jgi:phosphate transport system permease protein
LRLLTERQKDRLATVLIRTGGLLVILVVVGIVLNIGSEALPLFGSATAGSVETVWHSPSLAAGTDSRREVVWVLGDDAAIQFTGADLPPLLIGDRGEVELVAADHEIGDLLTAVSADGTAFVGRVRFTDAWTNGRRSATVGWRPAADPLPLGSGPWIGVTANTDDDGNLLMIAWDAAGQSIFARWEVEDEVWSVQAGPHEARRVVGAAVAQGLATVALIDSQGRLHVYRADDLTPMTLVGVEEPTAAARFLLGGGTLVAAARDGSVAVVLEVPRLRVENRGRGALDVLGTTIAPGEAAVLPDDEIGRKLASRSDVKLATAPPEWTSVRRYDGAGATPTAIAAASRRRGFAVGGVDGSVALYYSTSGRMVLADRWSEAPVRSLAIDPKSDGIVAVVGNEVLRRWVDNPHPEISLRTLFLPVWYEGYAAPKWVWQSTGGSDAFEPKLSVWPLIFGTLKATVYAMLFSVPLALLAAVYVSQLAPPWLQTVVKPTLELMAAVPSVVVGFLAALWLAPRLEDALLAVALAALALPFAVVLALLVWRAVPTRLRRALPFGAEIVVLVLSAAAVIASAAALAGPLEMWLFDGDLQRYLFTEWGIRYDQRNSIVVGLALGFAVIPIIFTIAEDACSAVPRALVNASRALGATRWQTAVRLVVPAASPGLFAAVMLGLGRAVGETMIVLMAAGNTPVLDLSVFNGMRTMSAAIAVEIPEAPVGGTLFRVLFLTGTLLFVFTFLLTSVADLVGSHLRKRYARF